MMEKSNPTQAIISSLDEIPNCHSCGVRLRFGDYECPKFGADFYDSLELWAENVIKMLNQSE